LDLKGYRKVRFGGRILFVGSEGKGDEERGKREGATEMTT
jgi:hypothetical protein